jgi:hypothetical protein
MHLAAACKYFWLSSPDTVFPCTDTSAWVPGPPVWTGVDRPERGGGWGQVDKTHLDPSGA